jgi:hypothetical protein
MPSTDPIEGEDPNSLKNRITRWLGVQIIFAGTHVGPYHFSRGMLLTKTLVGYVCGRQDLSCESDAQTTDWFDWAEDTLGRNEAGAFWLPTINVWALEERHPTFTSLVYFVYVLRIGQVGSLALIHIVKSMIWLVQESGWMHQHAPMCIILRKCYDALEDHCWLAYCSVIAVYWARHWHKSQVQIVSGVNDLVWTRQMNLSNQITVSQGPVLQHFSVYM